MSYPPRSRHNIALTFASESRDGALLIGDPVAYNFKPSNARPKSNRRML
jgi:hypothetical protein